MFVFAHLYTAYRDALGHAHRSAISFRYNFGLLIVCYLLSVWTEQQQRHVLGDYAVEESWELMTVRFFNRDYFDKFKDSLLARYPQLIVWRDARRKPEGQVVNASGQPVRLALARDNRAIFISDVGAQAWIMSDFQTICKNIHVAGWC